MPLVSTKQPMPTPTARPSSFAAAQVALRSFIAEALQRALELAGQIAGVINHVMKWMLAEIVGHFFMADQVASSYVGGIELETMRDDIY